jgi:plastocyanin
MHMFFIRTNLWRGRILKVFVLRKNVFMLLFAFLLIGGVSIAGWYTFRSEIIDVIAQSNGEVREINIVTVEFDTKTESGKEIELYRWDPGTIFVKQGEQVRLKLYGFNGMEHPFFIEGTDIQGTVKKGQETIVDVKFDKKGVYRLICMAHSQSAHSDEAHKGPPMIGYIVVQ